MSERNVELMRRWVAAVNARDVKALIACCDPDVEWHPILAGGVAGTVYHGHEGVRSYLQDVEDAWGQGFRVEPEAYFELAEHMLAFYVLHGRGRHSGAEVVLPGAGVARSRNGLITYIRAYPNREDALRALGVTEGELEPIAP